MLAIALSQGECTNFRQNGILSYAYYPENQDCSGMFSVTNETVIFDGNMNCDGGFKMDCINGKLIRKHYLSFDCEGDPIAEYTSNVCYKYGKPCTPKAPSCQKIQSFKYQCVKT